MKPNSVLEPALIAAFASATQPTTPDAMTSMRMREQLFQRVHSPAHEFLFVQGGQGEWLRLTQGVEFRVLRQDGDSCAYMLRMEAGARLPPHKHPQDEECLVLEGDATINGVLCRVGDYHLAPQGSPHQWLTTEKGCLMFVRGAAVHPAHA